MTNSIGDPINGEILIVEDALSSLILLTDILSNEGYIIRQALDGEMALATIGNRTPDLIILDVDMPGMDGFEVCREIKEKADTSHIPVIFCSAFSSPQHKVKGLSVGAVDFIAKPYHFEEVLVRVRTHLELSRLRNSLEKEVAKRTQDLESIASSLRKEISEKQNAQKELMLASKAYEASFSGIMIADCKENIVSVNPAFSRITGYCRNDVVGSSIHLILSKKDDLNIEGKIRSSVSEQGNWSGEIWCARKDGNVIPTMYTIFALNDSVEQVTHYIITIADLSESKDAQTLIDFLAHRDSLTGLANRLMVRKQFEQMVATAKVGGGISNVLIMCLDLDRFKVINDSLGHAVGDQLLKHLASRLSDLLSKGCLLSREGGDEFLIITDCRDCADKAEEIAQKILAEVSKGDVIDHHRLSVTTSIGAAVYPNDGVDFSELLMNAENALYSSKKRGGNCFSMFTPQMDAEARLRMELESCMRNAVASDEFQLVYQPKVSLETGCIVGAEALVRWNSPVLGFVSPANFIPLAEETGLILDIDEWVVGSVCQQISLWRSRGIDINKVSVNLSALQFQRGDLITLIESVLSASDVDPYHLDLEITEGLLMWNFDSAIAILNKLKDVGVSISLDDFGTGYSSLSYLQKLPIDTLKIDKTFVDEIHLNKRDAAITGTIIALANSLGLNVVAEGVEHREQYELLKENRCHEIQGYYFSKPLAPDDFEQLFLKSNQHFSEGG